MSLTRAGARAGVRSSAHLTKETTADLPGTIPALSRCARIRAGKREELG